MRVQPFKAEDALPLVQFLGPYTFGEETFKGIERAGMSFTGFIDDKVVAVSGVYVLHKGVAEAYAFLDPEVRKVPFGIHRAVKRGLLTLQAKHQFHRIQMNVEHGFLAGYRWAESLGFEQEGVMRQYGSDKKTFTRFARIWPTLELENH